VSDEPAVRLSLQVFEDDDPALVARLRALPKSKVRRREHLIRLLRLGVAAEASGDRGYFVSTTPMPNGAGSASPTVASGAPTAIPDVPSAKEADKPRAFDTILDPEDLAAIFSASAVPGTIGA
jgi:hypothetical protein